jgi:peptidoglycan hydrolase-like protein with peptidoglycan-binding domain
LTSDQVALAKVGMPLGGGTIQSLSAVTGPHSRPVAVQLRGSQIWPEHLIRAGETLSIQVVVKRPGWISWLAGSTETLHLSVTAPTASLVSHYLTLAARAPLQLHFKAPILAYAYGVPGHLRRHVLAAPSSVVTLPRTAVAGNVLVSATPRSWESSGARLVSWFPAGATATAVADPAPGSTIKAGTPIMLTFSKPIAKALGSSSHRPPVLPITQGVWHTVNSHTIIFRPEGYGYGLGAKVAVALPAGVRLIGGARNGSSEVGTWTVPPGSTARLQQMLAQLGYLPLTFHYKGAGVGLTLADQEAAAIDPPAGRFSWRYANTPSALRSFWSPGASGVMTRGALMSFENDHGILADGVAGPLVWKALIAAMIAGHRSSFGYTFVSVSVSSQSLNLWHSGKTVIGGTPVNTGIASAPTATGTYPVYEHLPVTTMSGTNPDGSHYSDPGIPDVSYFNGGDALHGFTRAQYGSPQSLGCVEMPYSVAAQVYPYTPIGTLVHVA